MQASLIRKLTALEKHHAHLATLLSDVSVIDDQNRFRELSKEYAQLEPIIENFRCYQATLHAIEYSNQLLLDADLELQSLAAEEIKQAQAQQQEIEKKLQLLLIPKDANDQCHVFLEIRAAAGGDEAAIFVGDLFRMYLRYAESKRWSVDTISSSAGEHGGYKEIIAKISGEAVYSRLKFESGAHRVQRIPETEAQGRIHTSTCTIAVLPAVDTIDEVILNPSDLRIDTFRSSGAGGQHVQKTDSAIRITHLPTGIVVECQDERSQHKNRARAMSLLQARILSAQRNKQQREQAETRRNLVGTGDRSERIRTYNFPQARVTDHRINLTLYKLMNLMEGDVDLVIDPLLREHEADLLAFLNDEK